MSYLGNTLQVANASYRIIDDISSGFNGVTTSFALKVLGITPVPFPLNEQNCLISVGGVPQKPDSTGAEGFKFSGGNIVFSSAPAAGEKFWGVILAGADYVNVGANFPSGTAAVPSVTFDQSTGTGLFLASTNVLGIATGGLQRLTVDSSGNVGIGTTSPGNTLSIYKGSTAAGIVTLQRFSLPYASGADNGAEIAIGREGQASNVGASIRLAASDYSSDSRTYITFSTTGPGGGDTTNYTAAERVRIDSSGNLLVNTLGTSATSWHTIRKLVAQDAGNVVLEVGHTSTGVLAVCAVTSGYGGGSATNAGVRVGRDGVTNRSINASGTINASGADYAEYMTKANNFTIAKGDICGVTADGLLTINYAAAVSFVVKSTDPSYVGSDTWGSESIIGPRPDNDDSEALADWKAALELERQKVDRIAFAGQVPVNVMGATPGQYIVPVATKNGGITAVAKDKSEMMPAEYMDAVGKVIAIEDDGRARIIVKVA